MQKKGIKGKINSALDDLKGNDMSVEYEDEVFEMFKEKTNASSINSIDWVDYNTYLVATQEKIESESHLIK